MYHVVADTYLGIKALASSAVSGQRLAMAANSNLCSFCCISNLWKTNWSLSIRESFNTSQNILGEWALADILLYVKYACYVSFSSPVKWLHYKMLSTNLAIDKNRTQVYISVCVVRTVSAAIFVLLIKPLN